MSTPVDVTLEIGQTTGPSAAGIPKVYVLTLSSLSVMVDGVATTLYTGSGNPVPLTQTSFTAGGITLTLPTSVDHASPPATLDTQLSYTSTDLHQILALYGNPTYGTALYGGMVNPGAAVCPPLTQPVCTGEAAITIWGKALLPRCDAPETRTALNRPDGSVSPGYYDGTTTLLGYFHSSPPLNTGAFGARYDPTATVADSSPESFGPSGFIIGAVQQPRASFYNYGVSPSVVRGVLGDDAIYQSLLSDPPGSVQRNGTPRWYWSSPGGLHPNPNTFIETANGGYDTGALWRNSWANQFGLVCTTLDSNGTSAANQGAYQSYLIAADFYPIGGYGLDYLMPSQGNFGTAESYVVQVDKHVRAQLVVVTPDGTRQPNPFLLWNGIIVADTETLYAYAPQKYPPFDMLSYQYFNYPGYPITFGFLHRRPFLGNWAFLRNVGKDDALHLNLPPVPAPINTSDVGNATFDVKPQVAVHLDYGFGYYTAGSPYWPYVSPQGPLAGATLEMRIEFTDGTHYTWFTGVTDSHGDIAATAVDYWMGQTGPNVPAFASLLHGVVTLPNGTVIDSQISSEHAYFSATMDKAIVQPAQVDGLWTCQSPPVTHYAALVVFPQTLIAPPAPPATPYNLIRRLLVPSMDVDPATGRLVLALGMAAYQETWEQVAALYDHGAPAGTTRLRWKRFKVANPVDSSIKSFGVQVSASTGPLVKGTSGAMVRIPWVTGTDAGQPAAANVLAFPDGLTSAAHQGLLRVGISAYVWNVPASFSGTASAYALSLPAGTVGYYLRDSLDIGRTWQAGPVNPGNAPSSQFLAAAGQSRTAVLQSAADARQQPKLPAPLFSPAPSLFAGNRGRQHGASGFVRLRAKWLSFLRLPVFAARGTGPYAAFKTPALLPLTDPVTAPLPAHAASAFPCAVQSTDGKVFTYTPLPSHVGSIDPAFTGTGAAAVPGYPFPSEALGKYSGTLDPTLLANIAGLDTDGTGSATDTMTSGPDTYPVDGSPLFGLPAASQPRPASPLGGVAIAAGIGLENGSVYVFQPAIMRPPIPREFYPVPNPFLGHPFPDGASPFKAHTDPELDVTLAGSAGTTRMTTGRDFGQRTCVCWTYTGDSGETFGPLGVVQVSPDGKAAGRAPLLADSCEVRIAAASLKGGRIMLCVCDGGIATLYASDNGCAGFFPVSYTADAGKTWQPGASPKS